MKLAKFNQFERASKILEKYTPETVTDELLKESNISREDLAAINEGILGDIFGGLLKGLKEKILKAVPGSVMKKADAILKEYKEAKMGVNSKIMQERNKLYKASLEVEQDPNDATAKKRFEELKVRVEKAVQQIELANKSRMEAIERKLKLLTQDKSETLNNYVQYQLAEIQEQAAKRQLEDAENNASEDILKEIEDQVKKAADLKRQAAEELKKQDEEKKKEASDKEEKERNDPTKAKKGQVWLRVKSDGTEQEVTVLEPLKDGIIRVKAKTPFGAKPEELKKLIKDVEAELKKVA